MSESAALARTSVEAARVGMLTTYARHPSAQLTTSVTVRPRPDGTVEVELARDAAAVRQLVARPVASLELAPLGCQPVLLHGAVRRLVGLSQSGALRFLLDVAAVRVGAPPLLVDERAYSAARPDPLAHEAQDVLAHLNAAHAAALAACLRAVGHRADYARATSLDTGGLTVAAVTEEGVATIRLPFPEPVTALEQLPASIGGALSPRCGCSASQSAPRDPHEAP